MSDLAYIVFCQNSTAVFRPEKEEDNEEEEDRDDDEDVDDNCHGDLLLFLTISQTRSA
jgi:hypothetical protein